MGKVFPFNDTIYIVICIFQENLCGVSKAKETTSRCQKVIEEMIEPAT